MVKLWDSWFKEALPRFLWILMVRKVPLQGLILEIYRRDQPQHLALLGRLCECDDISISDVILFPGEDIY
ncbi:MAG: hypothetical protein ACJAWL_003207 [Motiliproteus sp.]|jgi:hypothetical protein